MGPPTISGLLRGLALVSFMLLGCPQSSRDDYPQQRRLITLLGEARSTRPRFTGFAAGPCGQDAQLPPRDWLMQCAESPQLKPSDLRELKSLWNQLEKSSPSADHARGVWEAHAAGSSSGLYGALLSLRQATAMNSAAAWNDMGAVHLLLYGSTGSMDELVSGLEAFERALDLEPRREEARFNLALTLQILGLDSAAAKEWRTLLVALEGSPWEGEIRGYLDRLGRDLAATRSPSLDRRSRGEVLLAVWARRGGNGPEAERALDQAFAIGAELGTENGDRLLLDSASFAQSTKGTARETLVQAHALLAKARNGNDYASCSDPALEEAEQQFTRTGSPFGVWARIDLAVCDFFDKDFASARLRLASILKETSPAYRIARARAFWILGLVELRAGRLPIALGELRKASSVYSAVGERRFASYLQSLIARTLRHMGWSREGWLARGQALAGLREMDPERRYNVLEEVIETLDEESRFHAARPFLDAQFAAARAASRKRGTSDLPVFAALNAWDLAWTAGDAGRAKHALQQAVLSLRQVPSDTENRERLEREVALARSWIEDGDKDSYLRDLLAFYDRHGEGEQLDALKHLQLRVAMDLARHERGSLRVHLEAALQRAEAIAHWAVDADQRRLLQHRRRWLCARLVELEAAVDGRRALLAFLRGSAPLPESSSSQSAEEALSQLRASLPPGGAVLIHFSIEQGTFGWLVGADHLQSWRAPVGAFELGQLTTALRDAAVSGDPATFRRISEQLGRTLLPPSGLGPAGADLFVVADEKTAGLPFPILVDPATGRPLLDDHAIVIQSQIERLASGSQVPISSVLVIADPDFEQAAFPGLTSLRFARKEGENIVGLYQRSEKWTGRSVSMDRLEAAFRQASVVHLATHAYGPREGREAGLVLGTEGDGVLGADDVQRLGLRAPVVVLAACRSAEQDKEEPGSSSIAQAFLDAGSGAVIASLWPVDDQQSSIMFLQFHKQLLRGKNPAQALRAAQLALRDQFGSSAQGTWSAFQVFGGTEVRPFLEEKR